jgi:hypothetical protein
MRIGARGIVNGPILLFGVLLGASVGTAGCSFNSCAENVKSEEEAHRAVASFYSAQTYTAKRAIAELRQEGMTDEYLTRLQQGCSDCYLFPGSERQGYEPDSWYATVSIAPAEKKRAVILEIDCAESVLLSHTLHGR